MSDFDLQNYIHYFSNEGRSHILELIHATKRDYGENWISGFKTHAPELSFAIDLAANYDADEAFTKLSPFFGRMIAAADLPFWKSAGLYALIEPTLAVQKENIYELHRLLRDEIDKPQF